MIKKILVIVLSAALFACSSDQKKLEAYLSSYYPEYELQSDDKITTDSAFCPISKLESNSIELMGLKAQVFKLYAENPDSAYRLALKVNEQYGGKEALGNLTYPTGGKNCVSYTVKCKSEDNERYIVFYKDRQLETIEYCSLDADERIDSIMNQYAELMYAVNVILKKRAAN